MSRSELHNWECAIESLCGDNADKMLAIAQDIYNTAFVHGKNYMSLEQFELEQTRWRSVSEPPKEDGKYLVSRKNEENIWVEEAYYSTTSRTTFPKGFSIINDNFSWRINNVIAWMPLPQPYKAESEEEE